MDGGQTVECELILMSEWRTTLPQLLVMPEQWARPDPPKEGDEVSSTWLRIGRGDFAVTMRERNLSAERWLLGVQAEFKRTSGQRIVTTQVFYGGVKLATAQTRWTGEDDIT